MKKFKFRMEKLLSYKGQLLDSEMMNLAVLNSLLEDAEERLEGLLMDLEKSREEFQNKVSEHSTPADWRMHAAYERHMNEQIKQCEEEIERLIDQIEKQIERVKDLKIETKTLETIKESRYMEYVKEDLKMSEQFMDEFVSTKRVMSEVF